MKRQIKRAFILFLATVFLVLAIIGSVLPVLQGWFFLAISILLFSMCSPRLRAWVDKHTVRWPKLHSVVNKADRWIIKIVGPLE
jgi:uncharacterized membrane protein YbaN (DUF454 family)